MSITFLLFLDHYFLKNEKKYTWVVRKWSRSVSGAPTVYLSEFWLVENFGELWRHNVPVEGFNMYTRARIPSKTYIAGLWSLGNPTISKNILGTTHYEASLLSFHFSRYSWRCVEYPRLRSLAVLAAKHNCWKLPWCPIQLWIPIITLFTE